MSTFVLFLLLQNDSGIWERQEVRQFRHLDTCETFAEQQNYESFICMEVKRS